MQKFIDTLKVLASDPWNWVYLLAFVFIIKLLF